MEKPTSSPVAEAMGDEPRVVAEGEAGRGSDVGRGWIPGGVGREQPGLSEAGYNSGVVPPQSKGAKSVRHGAFARAFSGVS